MKYRYVDTADIEVSIGLTTGQLKQIICWMTAHYESLDDDSLEKATLGFRIEDMNAIYQRAIRDIAQYAEGQKQDV